MFSHIRQAKTISRCVGDPRAHDNTAASLPSPAHGYRPFPKRLINDHENFCGLNRKKEGKPWKTAVRFPAISTKGGLSINVTYRFITKP